MEELRCPDAISAWRVGTCLRTASCLTEVFFVLDVGNRDMNQNIVLSWCAVYSDLDPAELAHIPESEACRSFINALHKTIKTLK